MIRETEPSRGIQRVEQGQAGDTGIPIAHMRRYAEMSRDDSTVADRIALLEQHDREVGDRLEQLAGQREHIREKIRYNRSVRRA